MENSQVKKVPVQYAGAYRNFVTGKYSKYKQQKGGLTDKQILDTIISQWQNLDEETKKGLKQEYVDSHINSKSKNKSITKDKSQISWLEQDARSLSSQYHEEGRDQMDSNEQSKKKNDNKKEKRNPKIELPTQGKNNGQMKKIGKQQGLDKKQEQRRPTIWEEDSEVMHESNFIMDKIPKTKGKKIKAKKIKKKVLSEAQNQYINFSKFHHQKLKMEHPEWSIKQLRNIVKLLWKKRKQSVCNQSQKNIPKNDFQENQVTRMSGKKVYKQSKQKQGSNQKEIEQNWKELPFESKKYWQRKGKGSQEATNKRTGYNLRFMRKHENEAPSNKIGPSWMNKIMK